jgi:predicted nucleic acid-binding protein
MVAWVQDEPAAIAVEEFLEKADKGVLAIHVVVPDEKGIMAAARVKAANAVAYGDSFAIALAQAEGASIITGDDEIRRCALVPVDWIGNQPPVSAR